jgi:hypothetical protein
MCVVRDEFKVKKTRKNLLSQLLEIEYGYSEAGIQFLNVVDKMQKSLGLQIIIIIKK